MERSGISRPAGGWRTWQAHGHRCLRLGAAAWIALTGCGNGEQQDLQAGPPNLLVITLDTVRADHLGCYGYTEPTSPVLDRLAARSVLFENTAAQAAVTPVSHASIFTGLNPYHHGLRALHGGTDAALPPERLTLAEILRAAGYTTGAFVSAFTATRHFGLDQGFGTWDEEFHHHDGRGIITPQGVVNTGDAQRRADETTLKAVAWLAGQGKAPFFLWVHYFDAHDAVLVPPDDVLARFAPKSVSKDDRLRAVYDAEISFVDAQIGELLGALEERGLRERTIVAVLSDHGEGLGDHRWWGHTILYQEQVRLAFILSVPGAASPRRVPDPVRAIDFVPTVLDYLALSCPGGPCRFDGSSLRGVVAGRAGEKRIAYAESLNDLAAYYGSPLENDSLYSVTDWPWKLIARYEGPREKPSMLFDLETDPGERVNRIGLEPSVARRLRDYIEAVGAVTSRGPSSPLDSETKQRLQSLGYVN